MPIFTSSDLEERRRITKSTLSDARIGDEILAVNGTTMNGLTHAEGLAVFKRINSGSVELLVTPRPSGGPKCVDVVNKPRPSGGPKRVDVQYCRLSSV